MSKLKRKLQRRTSDRTLYRRATLRTQTANEDTCSIEAVIATETPLRMYDYSHGNFEEILLMDGVRYGASVPLLDTHNRYSVNSVLGHTGDFRVESGQLFARNYYAADPASQAAWGKARDGHLTDNSVGYRIGAYTIIEKGTCCDINGRAFTAGNFPLRVVTDWEIVENSVCPIGADAGAKNRKQQNKQEKLIMLTEKQIAHIRAKGFDPEELTELQCRALLTDFDQGQRSPSPEKKSNPAPADDYDQISRDAKVRSAAAVAERQRADSITKLAAGGAIPAELVQAAIDDGISVDEARAVFYRHITTSQVTISGAPAIHVTDKNTGTRQMEAALLLRAGVDDKFLLAQYDEPTLTSADQMRTMSMIEMAGRCLALEGRVLPAGRDEMIRSALSTITLPTVLGNIANKAALRGYTETDNSWASWCSSGSVSDFKNHTRVRMTDVGDLELINKDGEIAHGSLTEEKESLSIDTYGKQLTIGRQDWYNDDLGMFVKLGTAMGRRAGKKIADLVYDHLIANPTMGDGNALFVSGHNNLVTSNALDSDGLAAAILAFRKQKDADGKYISVSPKYLIIPPDLENTARGLLEGDLLLAVGIDSSKSVQGNKNIYKGILKPVVEPRLSGSSATTWYLAGSPSAVDTIEVAYLNGRRTPVVEKTSQDFDTLGIKFRVYIDAGVKALDWRGMVKCTA